MKVIKKFSFWLTIFAVVVVLYNMIGKDDKNLLLFFTSPPFWVTEYYPLSCFIFAALSAECIILVHVRICH